MVLGFSSLQGWNTHTNTCTNSFTHYGGKERGEKGKEGEREREGDRNADRNTKIATKHTRTCWSSEETLNKNQKKPLQVAHWMNKTCFWGGNLPGQVPLLRYIFHQEIIPCGKSNRVHVTDDQLSFALVSKAVCWSFALTVSKGEEANTGHFIILNSAPLWSPPDYSSFKYHAECIHLQ